MSTPSLSVQLLAISVFSLQRQLSHNNFASRSTWNPNYDFIVVGAGGAGAIVAARLSENASVNVLLLEAGGPESVITDMPGNFYQLLGNPEIDWNYPMERQSRIGQAYPAPATMSVGRVLGGSTIFAANVYNRGNRRHFDQWDYEYGCRGWNYNAVLPYFRRSENETDPKYLSNGNYHSTNGPITVSSDWSHLENELPVFKDYIQTAQMAGYPIIDPNGPTQNGVTLFQHTARNGVKMTTSAAYLSPNRNRSNLHILTKVHVTSILFNGVTAVGVTFIRAGINYTVMANRETILSAGTIGSAQLLLLSGVGPQMHLANLGIPLVANLPVGNNFHDHANTILYFDLPKQNRSYESAPLTVQNMYNYFVNGAGPLSFFPNAGTFIVTNQNNDPQWPDVMTEMIRSNSQWNNLSNIYNLYNNNQQAWVNYWAPYSGRRLLGFNVQNARPRARGTVRLASTNPLDTPLVDPNYLADSRDMEAMVQGLKTVLQITKVGPFSKSAAFIDTPVPGCRSMCYGQNALCDEYIRCFIRQTCVGASRHAGTCRCGATADPNAVVDERLRVINVNKLRVIDGSVMPQVVNSNPGMATAMIAERGAQMIRDDNAIL